MKSNVSFSILLAAAFACGSFAQNATSLQGVATDTSGGVLPNVAIEITNKQTDARRTDTSDSQGRYSFLQVVPGNYRLEAKVTGFRSVLLDNLELQVNSPATVNLKFEIGSVMETVAVSSESILVNTTDASIGNAIGEKPIVGLPFEARNPVGLLALQPGVVYINNGKDDYRSGAVNGGT